ncbi:MAG: hypothetical protein EOM55_01370 [Clostridia bacterium]|nr:hypothetical protein [Clostridia bacterium]
MKFTDDQKKVLENNSKKLLVSASAGSGKTATIIEKIVRIITEEKVEIEKLLSITFTDASSVEVKIRLKDALREGASTDNFVREQFEKLSVADISTLHGFCSKMIRKYFYQLDLKPNFAVLDENNSKFLKVNALEKTIDFYSKNEDEEFVKLSSIFEGGGNFDGLKRNILSLYEFLCALCDKENYLQNVALKLFNEDFEKNEACEYLNNYIISNFNYLKTRTKDMLQSAQEQKSEYFTIFLNEAILILENINQNNSFLQNREIVAGVKFKTLSSRSLSDADKMFYEDFKPFWSELKEKISDIKNNVCFGDSSDIKLDLMLARKMLEKLLEVVRTFEKYYNEAKSTRNALDFNDLESYFLKLLSIDEIRNALNYEYIFVDEYQDINPVQEEIIRLLSTASKVVMVGDIKQSIYGFRNSTPEIFVQKSQNFMNDNSQGNLVILNENFRSNPVILNFVNSIFEKSMSLDFGGVDYKNSGAFKAKIEYPICSNVPVVEVDIIDSKKSIDDEDEESIVLPEVYSVLGDKNNYEQELTDGRKEAMIVAKKILEIYDKDIFDAKESITKKIKFSDIVILCRNNEYLKEVAKGLLDYKVPIATNLVENVYKQIDVQVLLSLLKILNNFHDDISLSTFMTSFLSEFTFDDLAKIKRAFPDEKFFYDCVKNYAKIANFDDKNAQKNADFDEKIVQKNADFDEKIAQKIDKMNEFLAKIRIKSSYQSIFEILFEICEKTGYFDYLLSLPDGTNRSKTVKDFVSSFLNADYNYDLVSFLDFEKNYASSNKFKTTFSFGEDSVKMGTIHSSKGLEYPVVFLIGCGKTFSNQTFKEEILKHKDYGISMNSFDLKTFDKNKNIARATLTLVKRKQERSEELRLLYVALTRAKNHLFLVGNTNLSQAYQVKNPSESQGVTNYFSWILSGLKKSNFINLVKNKKSYIDKTKELQVAINVFNDGELKLEKKKETTFDFSNFDEKTAKELKEIYEFKIIKKKNIALKNSVSSLLRENAGQEESVNFSPKKLDVFESEMSNLSRSDLGTLYHNILEKVDFEKQFNKEVFLHILKDLNVGEKESKLVSFEKINNCINTIKNLGKIKTRKEVPFISYIPYCDIYESDEKTKVLVQGVADLLVKTEDKNYLIDYKITKAQTADQLVEKYKVQLKLYKICLEKALNMNFDGVYVYSFHLEKLIKIF